MKTLKICLLMVFVVGVAVVGGAGCSTPALEKANAELWQSLTADSIKAVFKKYEKEFMTTNKDLELEVNKDFLEIVRKRLNSLNLSDTEIDECLTWLPVPTSLNLVLVPDLSRRIVDDVNNPAQVESDTVILRYIWEAFKKYAQFKLDSEHRLAVDVTDEGQANGRFRTVADNLSFDFPKNETKRERIGRFDSAYVRYVKNIEVMYSLAKEKPVGADYWFYFKNNLSKNIRKNTLYNNYRNVLIIITDGYLEAESSTETGIWDYTGNFQKRSEVVRRIKQGYSVKDAVKGLIEIPGFDQKFPTLEVLVLEINKRKGYSEKEKDRGTNYDYDILKFLWTDWFTRLEIKNAGEDFFFLRNQATKDTKVVIDMFLSK